jgi:SOS response regulatory protein OraA/RecX
VTDDATPVIELIRPLPSDPNVRSVRVAGRVVARLRAADAEHLGLAPGDAWTPALAAEVDRLKSLDATRRAALGLLARRGYARRELLERLERRGLAHGAEIVDELAQQGWLDDAAYAADLARGLTRRRMSRELLVARIAARGVDPATAEAAADAAIGDTDPVDTAFELARARVGERATGPRAVRRVAGLLARHGFDEDTISAVLLSGASAVLETGLSPGGGMPGNRGP